MYRKKYIIGNWKMNGSRQSVSKLLQALKLNHSDPSVELIVLPSSIFLEQTQHHLNDSTLLWGAQNLSDHDQGAYTGEISATMLVEFGCRYVLCGHSERRHLFYETDNNIASKVQQAQRHQLIPIVCIGETLEQHQQQRTQATLRQQLQIVPKFDQSAAWILAYEPVWAIGTGLTASPEYIHSTHTWLRQELKKFDPNLSKRIPIVYGGSVHTNNIADLLATQTVDGVLVGAASLDAQAFLEIYASAVRMNVKCIY